MNLLKTISLSIAILLVLNLLLFALGKITSFVFWTIIVLGAITSFWIIPRINKR